MPNTPALKIGVAGVGVMGRNHARVASEMREFDLTTVFDPDAVTAEGVAAAYGASPVTTAQAFVDAGSRQFTYPTKDGRMMSMGYWSVPEPALDDPDEAVAWARRSLDVAVKKASGKKR